jgi:hypothetical protein
VATRRRRIAARALAALLVALPTSAAVAPVDARATEVDPQVKAKAAKTFRAAEAAFRRGDFRAAAEGFEAAYGIAPHPFALWNAVIAWDKAGEHARAANRCEAFLREAAADDRNRPDAEQLLGRLAASLAKIDVQADGGREITLDGAPIERGKRFVEPGDHVVGASFDAGTVTRAVRVAAGATERLALAPGGEVAPSKAPTVGPSEGASDAPGAHDKPLGKAWFFVGLGVTAALGGATIASGVDTNAAASAFHDHPTEAGLDEGRGKQTRTNALLVATSVGAFATAAIGVFAVRWSSAPSRAGRRARRRRERRDAARELLTCPSPRASSPPCLATSRSCASRRAAWGRSTWPRSAARSGSRASS